MNKLLITLLIVSVLFISACDFKIERINSSKECQEKFGLSCDYYECMGNHTVAPSTASMYYSQKTNCLLEKR